MADGDEALGIGAIDPPSAKAKPPKTQHVATHCPAARVGDVALTFRVFTLQHVAPTTEWGIATNSLLLSSMTLRATESIMLNGDSSNRM